MKVIIESDNKPFLLLLVKFLDTIQFDRTKGLVTVTVSEEYPLQREEKGE